MNGASPDRARSRWHPDSNWLGWGWLGLIARLVLGGVWITAGALKLPDPAESIRAVRAYRLLPEAIVPTIGYGLPVLEVAVGLLLIVGIGVRLAAVVSTVLLAAFLFGISAAWARGLQIDCGCFGGGGQVAKADTRYPEELARDAALFLAALLLVRWPRTRLALATVLNRPASTYDEYDDELDPTPTSSTSSISSTSSTSSTRTITGDRRT